MIYYKGLLALLRIEAKMGYLLSISGICSFCITDSSSDYVVNVPVHAPAQPVGEPVVMLLFIEAQTQQ